MTIITQDSNNGVSWGAILAGAVAAAALSFALLILGFGLGLSIVSPWDGQGASAAAIGITGILWITFTQIAASGLGGYLVGRLRTKWNDVNTDEVYFRDTAHGLVTWAVATLLAVAVFTSSLASVVTGGAQAGASIVGGSSRLASTMAQGTEVDWSQVTEYFTDSLLRPASNVSSNVSPEDAEARGRELATILIRSLPEVQLSTEDSEYLARVVTQNTGLSPQQAQARVNEVTSGLREAVTSAQEAVDEARAATAYTAGWMFIALLCGAFFASWMATIGGRLRDQL